MSRAFAIVWAVRISLALLTLTIGVLVFGPFSGAEAIIGLSDKEAHVLAFYSLCALTLLSMPRLRWSDAALMCLGFGAIIEMVQPIFGRDADLLDFMGDAIGVALCVLPLKIATLRREFRSEGHETPAKPRRRRTDKPQSERPQAERPHVNFNTQSWPGQKTDTGFGSSHHSHAYKKVRKHKRVSRDEALGMTPDSLARLNRTTSE